MAKRAATTAGSLHCPNCGAAVACDSTLCKYCKAKLATVGCPSCFGMTFVGSKHCPHCGAAIPTTVPQVPTKLPCPRCDVTMLAKSLKDTPLQECPRCCGLWIHPAAFTQICYDREKLASLPEKFLKSSRTRDVEMSKKYIPCPACKQLMNRYNFARVSGIVIDICKQDGVWFDRDELARIIEFIRSGGMEKARERQARELTAERQRLEFERHTRLPDSGVGSGTLIGPMSEPSSGLLVEALSVAGRALHDILTSRR